MAFPRSGIAAARRPRRRLATAGLALLLTMLLSLFPTREVSAHAELVRSEPAANTSLDATPKRIQLWFSEKPDPSFSEIQVLDRDGQRVDDGDSQVLTEDPLSMTVSLRSEMARGTYSVVWKTLSTVDGHVTGGAFAFAIGEAVDASAMSGGNTP